MRYRFLTAVLITVIASYAIGLFLSVPANPEVIFWQEVIEHRDKGISAVRKDQPNTSIIFFTGGSSTAFSIDPEIIEETCGIPCFNLGLPVSTGSKYLLHQALQRARSGDFIIVSLEHGLLISYHANDKPSKLSYALAVAGGNPQEAAGGDTFGKPTSITDHLTFSRPGANLLPTMIARKLIHKPYRYRVDDLRYRGRLETPIHDPNIPATGLTQDTHLTPDAANLLARFQQAAAAKNVRVAYSIPWFYTESSKLAECREQKSIFLQEISTIMPIVDDGFIGAADQIEWFADSALHLSAEGSKIRSSALAKPLDHWIKNRDIPK